MTMDDLKPGMTVITDGGFTCMAAGVHKVHADENGRLYLECDEGRHFLDGQIDRDGTLIGIKKAPVQCL